MFISPVYFLFLITSFKLFIDIGNQFGNIAIDDISFRSGPCPVVPQTASKDNGDCSFEENMCHWSNPAPQVSSYMFNNFFLKEFENNSKCYK